MKSKAVSLDGYQFELSIDHGTGRNFSDWFPQGEFDFPERRRYVFLSLKGGLWNASRVYDAIRNASEPFIGKPTAMPVTAVSELAIFLWPESSTIGLGDERMMDLFVRALGDIAVGDARSQTEKSGSAPVVNIEDVYEKRKAEEHEAELKEMKRVMSLFASNGYSGQVSRDAINPGLRNSAEKMVGLGYLRKEEKEEGLLRKQWMVYYEPTDLGVDMLTSLKDLTETGNGDRLLPLKALSSSEYNLLFHLHEGNVSRENEKILLGLVEKGYVTKGVHGEWNLSRNARRYLRSKGKL